MSKKFISVSSLALALSLTSGLSFACGGEDSGKHIGNVTAINKTDNTFTIRDMETRQSMTFKANPKTMANIQQASGHIVVNYEEDDEGALVAVAVEF